MHPFLVLEHLQENFKNYVLSKYPWTSADPEQAKLGQLCLAPGQVFQDPVIQLDRPRKKTPKLKSHEPEFFSEKMRQALQNGFPPRQNVRLRSFNEPFLHQIQAWQRISNGEATVISTGTGSGKSEAFMFPLLDRVVRAKQEAETRKRSDRRVIRAIVIYPMNALIEDQHIRFCRYASQLGLKIGVYNGSFNDQRKKNDLAQFEKRIRKSVFGEGEALVSDSELRALTEWVDAEQPNTYPDILLTNYSMLQYMLLRQKEHEIFRHADIQALVLDEAHLYSGTLGLEMSALIARLKTHIESLEGIFNNCVPVATSATLIRGGDEQSIERMRGFFESLFSSRFQEGWLIQDQFEEPHLPEPTLWRNLELPVNDFSEILLRAKDDVPKATEMLREKLKELQELPKLASQLPTILLSDVSQSARTAANNYKSVVSLTEAVAKFAQWRSGKDVFSGEEKIRFEIELKMLLTAAAMQQRVENGVNNPLLGLRVHSFVRSEPRLYREFRKISVNQEPELGEILSEDEVVERSNSDERMPFALPSAFCKNCGHEGWIMTAEDLGTGNTFELTPLTRQPLPDDQIIVFHRPSLEHTTWPESWKSENWNVSQNKSGTFHAEKMHSARKGKKDKTNPLMQNVEQASDDNGTTQRFLRVERTSKKGVRPDNTHCPSCMSTHEHEQMRVSRGSPTSDLSVHTRHLLEAAEDDDERRLLMFCDNRQDTSFLSGFITDRHKRFRLRRAIYQALDANQEFPDRLRLVDDREAFSSDFPFARCVLRELKRALADTSSENQVSTKTLRECLTSDLFDFDPRAKDSWDEKHQRFIELTEPSSLVRTSGSAAHDQLFLLEESDGKMALMLLTEGILRDLSLGAYKEGALGTLGMACLWSDSLNEIANTEEKALAWKIFSNLADEGHWTCRPKGLKLNSYNGQKQLPTVDDLLDKVASNRTGLHQFIVNNCPEIKERGDIKETMTRMLQNWNEVGLILLSGDKLNDIQINSRKLRVNKDVRVYRSKIKRKRETVPSAYDISHLRATKKEDDYFEPWNQAETEIPEAWRKLYTEKEAADFFVRAREHNAMISSETATAIIQTFSERDISKRTINTIIATPTLEMGIDLPDLPAVIHRSVPPDPSNYAQRSGRAGRDKKRALILAHCGRGSHDTSYFLEPEAMVAGEIIPPGCPRANTTILRRHMNAVCLQFLAEKGMNVSDWDAYLSRSEWLHWIEKKVGLPRKSPIQEQLAFDWKKVVAEPTVKTEILARILKVVSSFEKGLWRQDLLGETDKGALEQQLRAVIESDSFARSLEKSLSEYSNLLNKKKKRYEELPDTGSEKWIVLADLKSLLGGFGDERNSIKPINWLQIQGLLPNFDFPSDVATFTGFREHGFSKSRHKGEKYEVAVRFARGLNQAMREFCPEQSLYAAGAKFNINRYAVDRTSMNRKEQGFGICEKGCTQLTPISEHSVKCRVCDSPLVGHTEHKTALPPIYRLVRAEGRVVENIGDSRPDKDNSVLVREALVVGGGDGERVAAQNPMLGFTAIRRYEVRPQHASGTGKDTLLDLMTVVGAKRKESMGKSVRSIHPLFASSNDADEFYVALHSPENKDKQPSPKQCVHPFLLGNRFSAEGLHFDFDFSNTGLPDGLDVRETQYATFQATLLKAIRRELFLGPRSQTIDTFLDVSMKRIRDESQREVKGTYFYDAIPGGSGVMSLLRQNWRSICNRAHKIITQSDCCESSCKRCIATFDNQAQHWLLDKRKLKNQNGDVSIFALISDLFDEASSHWKIEQERPNDIYEHQEADEKFAEQSFRKFMAEMLPNARFHEQHEIKKLFSNSPITIADSVIAGERENVTVYVDGFDNHGRPDRFEGDIHKRNYIVMMGDSNYCTVPARWLVNSGEKGRWEYLKNSLQARISEPEFQPIETNRTVFSADENIYLIPTFNQQSQKFDQYNWLFDTPPKTIKTSGEQHNPIVRLVGYHAERHTLVVETDVHHHLGTDGRIDKELWHQFWEQMNQLQLSYGRVFVLLRRGS